MEIKLYDSQLSLKNVDFAWFHAVFKRSHRPILKLHLVLENQDPSSIPTHTAIELGVCVLHHENIQSAKCPAITTTFLGLGKTFYTMFCNRFPPKSVNFPTGLFGLSCFLLGQNINSGRGIVHCERLGRDTMPRVM